MLFSDVCVTGGGIIGLSIALEMAGRGASVTVIEQGAAMSGASYAAAGMLAAEDPDNPPELHDFARFSLARYDRFLTRTEELSGVAVAYQTDVTFQEIEVGAGGAVEAEGLPGEMLPEGRRFARLIEHSIDPRQLAAAVLQAVRRSTIRLIEHTAVKSVSETGSGIAVETSGDEVSAGQIVCALGAWSSAPVRPRKGQMLAVTMPAGAAIEAVVRTAEIYVVPRRHGPRAGQVLIGATVEDAGFSTTTDQVSLDGLRRRGAALIPALGDEIGCPPVDGWAGLRPDTPDHLPLIGRIGEGRRFVAAGHYRNGILLAPGTAFAVGQMLEGKAPGVNLEAFSPIRFR